MARVRPCEHELIDSPVLDLSNHYITDGRTKYIWFSKDGREQLFDLVKDPGENQNLAEAPAARSMPEWGRERLVEELTGREEGYTDGRRLIPGRRAVRLLSRK